jgi:uncharacterized membrane protein
MENCCDIARIGKEAPLFVAQGFDAVNDTWKAVLTARNLLTIFASVIVLAILYRTCEYLAFNLFYLYGDGIGAFIKSFIVLLFVAFIPFAVTDALLAKLARGNKAKCIAYALCACFFALECLGLYSYYGWWFARVIPPALLALGIAGMAMNAAGLHADDEKDKENEK